MCSTEVLFTERDVPDLSGYVTIVTGGNSGIGYETTKQLALRHARVYISSRSRNRVDQAIRKMRDETSRDLDVRFLQIDLNDLRSVTAAADTFSTLEPRLDLLFNNAGVMNVPMSYTGDGYETQWQVNYLAPFVFVSKLLPLMLHTASQSPSKDRVRIINITSDLAINIGPKTINFEDVNMTSSKGLMAPLNRYSHSKQGSIRHAKELNDRYAAQGVTAYSVHPGIIPSNLQSADPGLVGRLMRVGMKFRNTTPLEGCHNSLFCATTPLAFQQGQGKYFTPVGKANPKGDYLLNDKEGNERLWQISEAAMQRIRRASTP